LLTSFRQRWLPGVIGADVTFVRGFAEAVKLEIPFERALLDRVIEVSPLLRTLVLAVPRDLWRVPQWPWEAASPHALQQLTGLFMGGFQITDESVPRLLDSPDLAKLERLGLRSMQLVPSQLKRIAARQWLELDVHGNSLGARGADYLGGQQKLVALDIGSNDVGDVGVARLAELPTLERVSLRRSKLTAEGLPSLAKLPALRALNLSCNAIDAKAAAALAGVEWRSLGELDLRETGLDDHGLAALLESPLAARICVLDLASNQLTDARLLREAELPSLRSLNISGNPIVASAKEIKAALPRVRVVARARVDPARTRAQNVE
jgi:Leucine-rich repeat (LRR) protein